MKRLFILVNLCLWGILSLSAQNLTPYNEYYDYWQTMIKRKYTVLPNGVIHGTEQVYDKSGTLTNTNIYNNGKRESYKVHFRDKSINRQASVFQVVGTYKSSYDYTTDEKTFDICSSFKRYNINNKLIEESKLHSTTKPHNIGDNIGDYWVTLTNYSLSSYNYEDGYNGKVVFSTSADKSTETLKCYKADNTLYIDAVYDVTTETLLINTMTNNKEYSYKDGCLTITNPISITDEGDVYTMVPQVEVDVLKLKMSHEDFHSRIFNLKADDEGGSWYFVVEPVQFNFYLQEIIEQIGEEIDLQKKFYGKTFSLQNCGAYYIGPYGYAGIIELIDGDQTNGTYNTVTENISLMVTYVDGKLSQMKLMMPNKMAEHPIMPDLVYEGSAMATYKHSVKLETSLSNETIYGQAYDIYPDGEGTLSRGTGVTKSYSTGEVVSYRYEEYLGSFAQGYYSGQGKLTETSKGFTNEYSSYVDECLGEFKNGTFVKGEQRRISDNVVITTKNGETAYEITDDDEYKSIKFTSDFLGSVTALLSNGDTYEGNATISILHALYTHSSKLGLESWQINTIEDRIRTMSQNRSQNNKLCGKYTTASGDSLNGDFLVVYEGNVVEDFQYINKRFVKGDVDISVSNGRYIGEVADGKVTGKGKLVLSNGEVYEGNFINGVLDPSTVATVVVTLETGDRYEGQILEGKLHGDGIVYCTNGDYYKGQFAAGKFLGTGSVRVTTKHGEIYEGEVVDYKCKTTDVIKKITAYKCSSTIDAICVGKF